MKCNELKKLINSGTYPLVEFTKKVVNYEGRFEEGMRAYLVGYSGSNFPNIIELFFDEKEFVNYNKTLEQHVWYNSQTHDYDLKWSDDKYKKDYNGKTSVFEIETEEIITFKIVENSELFNEYLKSYTDISYIRWLENKVSDLMR